MAIQQVARIVSGVELRASSSQAVGNVRGESPEMKRFGITVMAMLSFVYLAHASDPSTKAQPTLPPDCYGSLLGWLNTSASDCPLTYAGFTLYGTLDMGAGYNTAGIRFGKDYFKGVYYGISAASKDSRWSLFPNAEGASLIGLEMEKPLVSDWLLIGQPKYSTTPTP